FLVVGLIVGLVESLIVLTLQQLDPLPTKSGRPTIRPSIRKQWLELIFSNHLAQFRPHHTIQVVCRITGTREQQGY
ncbi:unnamed protein product, partial [marine sediment metagenome]